MSGHGLDEFKFLAELKQRNVFRVTAAYLGVAWFRRFSLGLPSLPARDS